MSPFHTNFMKNKINHYPSGGKGETITTLVERIPNETRPTGNQPAEEWIDVLLQDFADKFGVELKKVFSSSTQETDFLQRNIDYIRDVIIPTARKNWRGSKIKL